MADNTHLDPATGGHAATNPTTADPAERALPPGYNTVNPFILCDDADALMRFITAVFDAVEHAEARTVDTDGLLLHAELRVGDSTIMFADRKPDWPYTPSLLRVYVQDVDKALATAVQLGGEVLTQPTDFFGEVFSRMLDPFGNMWWVFRPAESYADLDSWGSDDDDPSTPADCSDSGDQGEWGATEWDQGDWEPSPELTYIRDSLMTAIPRLVDPRTSAGR